MENTLNGYGNLPFVNKIFPMFFCLIAMLNSGIRRYENMK